MTVTTWGWVTYRGEVRRFENQVDDDGRRATAISIGAIVFQPRCSNVTLDIDKTWFDNNALTKDTDVASLEFGSLRLSEVTLYDDQQKASSSLEKILLEEIEIIRKENVTQKQAVHVFDQPRFLGPEVTKVTYIKLNKVVFDIEVETTDETPRFNLKNLVNPCLSVKFQEEYLDGLSSLKNDARGSFE